MLYTDTQEVGGAWTDGRGLLLAQKLAALTQLGTQTANAQTHTHAHANTHTHTHEPLRKGVGTKVTALCRLLLTHLCETQTHTFL